MAEPLDCVVIGAGVVGLACAARLAEAGRDVLVLEQHELIGSETSSRNSEVIHAESTTRPDRARQNCVWKGRRCSMTTAPATPCRTHAAARSSLQ